MRRTTGFVMGLTMLCGAFLLPADSVRAQSPAAAPALSGLPDYRALAARYPGADAVVLFDSLFVSLDDDNRVSKRRHRAVMLFTDNAINRYGDPRILFNTAAQELSVIVARVYMRDGTIADTQKNGMNQTTPFALDRAPDYVDWQETVVTHVGVEKGCVAELHYIIQDKVPSPRLSGIEIFSSEDPVEVRVLDVRASGAGPLKCASLGGAPEPDASVAGVRRWTVRNIAGRTPFNGGAWEGDYFPVACYSTASDWPSLLSEVAATLAGKTGDHDFFSGVVRKATENLQEDEDRILAIHRLALDCVTSVHAPFGLLAAAPRDAGKIYESGYASPLDRAVLLMAMLAAGSYEPVVVLAAAGRAWTDEAPAPELFGSVLVAAKFEDGELYLDPGASLEHDPLLGLAGRTCARLEPHGAIVRLPARKAGENRSSLRLVLKRGEEGTLAGEGTAVLTGIFSPYYVMRGAGTEAADFVEARVRDLFGGAVLKDWNPQRLERSGAEIAFTFTVKLPDAKAGERAYLALPRPFETGASGTDRVRPERSGLADAIALEPCELDFTCEIETPEGWKVISPPRHDEMKNEIGFARATVDTAHAAKTYCGRALFIEESLVLPAAYGKLKELLASFGEDQLVLERE
jgi:hypothetical protein